MELIKMCEGNNGDIKIYKDKGGLVFEADSYVGCFTGWSTGTLKLSWDEILKEMPKAKVGGGKSNEIR